MLVRWLISVTTSSLFGLGHLHITDLDAAMKLSGSWYIENQNHQIQVFLCVVWLSPKDDVSIAALCSRRLFRFTTNSCKQPHRSPDRGREVFRCEVLRHRLLATAWF
jgi:hypothetical protein